MRLAVTLLKKISFQPSILEILFHRYHYEYLLCFPLDRSPDYFVRAARQLQLIATCFSPYVRQIEFAMETTIHRTGNLTPLQKDFQV